MWKEKWLGVFIIPFINTINYYLTYTSMALTPFFFLTYSIDTVQGWIAWYAGRAVILRLDQYFPYEEGFVRRILIQVFCTNVVMLTLIALMTELVNAIGGDGPLPWSFYTENLVIFFIWILVFNGIYVSIHFYRSGRQGITRPAEVKIVAKRGRQKVFLEETDILFFRSESDLITATDRTGKTYYLDQSLKQLEEMVSPLFFRANRQFLIHPGSVDRFQSGDHGKIRLWIKTPGSESTEISVSRPKAATFRKWIQRYL